MMNFSQAMLDLEKNNLTKTIYMQDQFYKMKKSFSKFFRSLEPITMEYLNPSIKKEFFDDDIFISKIIFANSSDKYLDFANNAFGYKTTIDILNKNPLFFFIIALLLLLFILVNKTKLFYKSSNK